MRGGKPKCDRTDGRMDKLGGITGQVEWGTQTSFVQSMRAGRIGQHMKLTGGKGVIVVLDLGE